MTPLLPPGHVLPQAPPGRWRQLLADPALTMLVAEESDPRAPGSLRQGEPGELLGFTACGESRDADAGPNAGEIRTFFVAARSWRQGVGRALMASALADLAGR
ncbi:MAG TPA: GNAT family N-acetyltransferase, partial [Thermoleophilaceae bacterium]|nr:GNAT family N-acetyltransferase [Thermoleophilaceae bacterium]